MKLFQKSLFKRRTAQEALELASWARVEIGNLRAEFKTYQTALKKCENALNKLEGKLAELKQEELFRE